MRGGLVPLAFYCLVVVCYVPALAGDAAAEEKADGPASSSALLLKRSCQLRSHPDTCVLWGPSLLELIARPEVYDGRRVRVVGFVNFEFEGNAVYLSRHDWENGLTKNAVWVDPPVGFKSDWGPAQRQPNRRYVIIEATFVGSRGGHLNLFSGALVSVTRLDPWR